MANLKFKPNKGIYRLNLSSQEAALIEFLMSHVRLGQGTVYTDAAFSILSAFSECEEYVDDPVGDDEVIFSITAEDDNGTPVAVIDGYNAVFEITAA